jgi:hypothetical protein
MVSHGFPYHGEAVRKANRDASRIFAQQEDPCPIRDLPSLPNLVVFAEHVAIIDPFMPFRRSLADELERTRTELAAACADVLALVPAIRSGIVTLTSGPGYIDERFDSRVLYMHPLAHMALSLDSWVEYAKSVGYENPDYDDAIYAMQSLLGDNDPWYAASAQLIGRVDVPAFKKVVATVDFADLNGLTGLLTSQDGVHYARCGHERLTGSADVLALKIPQLELGLPEALTLRENEEVFQRFRQGLMHVLEAVPAATAESYEHVLREAAADILPDALAEFERIRSRSGFISGVAPMVGGTLLGAAVGAASHGFGSAAGRGLGQKIGKGVTAASGKKRASSDVAYRLTLNLIELGRM